MDEINELKLQKQCALKEINDVLSRIIINLKELNELVLPDDSFLKSLEEANKHTETLKQQVYLMESDGSNKKTIKKKKEPTTTDTSDSVNVINITINESQT